VNPIRAAATKRAARRDKLVMLPEWKPACQTAAPPGEPAALCALGSCGTFPRSRISHDSGLLHGSQSRFSTSVEISVQKGYGVTSQAHPSCAQSVTY
jgi:hypothetical protein